MSTPSRTSLQSTVKSNRSLSSGGSYSQTLDQLLGFGARPPIPGTRKLPEMNGSNGTTPTRNGSASQVNSDRPTTRHGNRSSSSNATSSSSSSKHRENKYSQKSIQNSEDYATIKLPETSQENRPVLSPVQSSSCATTNLNVWSREEDNQEHSYLDENNKFNVTNSHLFNQSDDDEDEVDEFTKKLQKLANRTIQARSSLVTTSNNSLLLNKKPSVIMEKGEGSHASSTTSSSSASASTLTSPKPLKINENTQAVSDTNYSEIRRRRSSALLANSTKQKTLVKTKTEEKSVSHGFETSLSSVHRLSQPKIRSFSASTAKEKNASKRKPWGSNINGKESKRSTSRPISTTAASLSGFPSHLEDSGRAISSTSSSYNAWLKHKMVADKKNKMALKEKQEEEERKKKEKKIDAEKCFQRWKEERDKKTGKEKAKQRREQEQQMERERIAKQDKKSNAEKTFECWKKSQLEQLRRHKSTLALDVKNKTTQKSREEEVKKKEAERAYNQWLQESVKRVSSKAQKIIEAEKEQGETEKKEKEYKEELAKEAYRLWLEMKREEENYAHCLAYKILEYDSEAKKRWPTAPWLPNGNTVPRKFIGQGNRRKTIEKPLTLKYSTKRTQSVH